MKLTMTFKWISAIALAVFLASCGGGSGSDSASNGSGTVAVMLTDGPTTDFDQVIVTVTGISVIARNGTSVQIFSGERTIDLLDLQDQSDVFTVADVPAGVYNKIRLAVSAVELVKLDPTTGEVIERVKPKLPGGKIDLNPRSPFIVGNGDSLVMQVDLDAEKSIHVTEAGNSGLTILRPVVFVDIIDGAVSARIAQVHGTVSSIDTEAQTFQLCGTTIDFQFRHRSSETERCLTVGTDTSTAFFNSDGTAGTFADVTVDGPATVIGHMRKTDTGAELVARIVYLGDNANLVRVRGSTLSAYDAGQFSLEVTGSEDFTVGQTIGVGVPAGAAIFRRNGLELTTDDIAAGLHARVLGLKTGATPDVQALAVILADPSALAETMISGAVGTVDANGFTLLPSATGNISADTTVCVGDQTKIYAISGGASTAIALGDLTSGWAANVYGHQPLGSCFVADTVIAFQP